MELNIIYYIKSLDIYYSIKVKYGDWKKLTEEEQEKLVLEKGERLYGGGLCNNG